MGVSVGRFKVNKGGLGQCGVGWEGSEGSI